MSDTEFLIGLDFLGAGNLGDDLMVSGFLAGIRRLGLTGKMRRLRALCSHDRYSQSRRFPEIEWIDGKQAESRKTAIKKANVLLGIGGTAFQVTSGTWLLDNIEELLAAKGSNTPLILVNIGSENEARREEARCQTLLRQISRLSTRDQDTLALLSTWQNGNSSPTLVPGADLANISLPELCATHPPLETRPNEIGMILGCDTLAPEDVQEVIEWIVSDPRPVSWITCEVRYIHGGEYYVYRKNKHRFRGRFLNRSRPRVQLHRPDYHSCSLGELVQPFAECKTIISSRYHGILSAAWSGCRVAGIARSSKVGWLCQQLGIPMITPPIRREAITQLQRDAVVVDISLLNQFRDLALQGIDGLNLSDC